MKNYLLKFSLFAILLLIISCNGLEDFDDPVNTERDLALPLFHSTTSLTNLLDGFNDETFVTIGPDDLINLNYKGNVTERTAEELFDFLDQILVPLADSVTSYPFDLPGTLDVTLMKIKAGNFAFNFTNTFDEKVNVTFRIPELVKNGVPFSKSTTIDSLSTGNNIWTNLFNNLDGYDLKPDDEFFDIIYEAYLESTGERVVFDGSGSGIGITGLEFSYIEGYWGQEILDLARDTIEIEFFENWVQGDVRFENPRIDIAVDNSFGFPVRSQVNLMKIQTVDGGEVDLVSQYIDNGIDFDYPPIDKIGELRTTVFSFDTTNSNVVEVLNSGPVNVDYDVDAVSNPDMIQELGFMTDSSYFKVQVSVELPFRGSVNDFKATDTYDINFEGYSKVEEIEFKMVAENAIPLGIDIQLFFADADGNKIDSLYTTEENILAPAPVGANGKATGEVSEKITFATIDAEKFERIREAKKLILVGLFFTPDASLNNAPIVSLESMQEVNIRMGMRVKTN